MAVHPVTENNEQLLQTKLDLAERHLVSLQAFFPRIDTKVSAIFAVASAQLGVTALNLSAGDLTEWHKLALLIPYAGFAFVIFANLYLCTYPHLSGGSRSLSYFGHVASMGEAEFTIEYSAMSLDDLHHDLSRQIWRNSQIIAAKYRFLKYASMALFASLIPWTAILALLSIEQGIIPALPG